MDFKVAGTSEFVTAIQLDTKLDGIPASVLAAALTQARDARLHILDVMAEAIDRPDEMSPYAPRVITVKMPVDKIGEVIGPKGKMINQIQEDTGADISIEDDGTVYIGATDGPSAEAARAAINAIANPTMPEVGERYMGTVVKTTTFGAFVSLVPGKDGLLHISQIRKLVGGKRVENVEDVLARRPEGPGRDRRDRPARQAVARSRCCRRARARAEAPSRTTPQQPARGERLSVTARTCRGIPLPLTPVGVARADRRRGGGRRRRAPFRPARRRPGPHRGDAGPALGDLGCWVGVGSRDEAPRPPRLHALPRAPALQGHGAALRAWTSRPPSTPSAARPTPSPARSTPATTPGCSTTDLPMAVDVLLDMVTSARLDDERRRERARGHPRRARDERRRPGDVVHERFAELVLGAHPLGRPDRRHARHHRAPSAATTSPRTTASTTSPPGLVVTAAGGVDHDALVRGRHRAAGRFGLARCSDGGRARCRAGTSRPATRTPRCRRRCSSSAGRPSRPTSSSAPSG